MSLKIPPPKLKIQQTPQVQISKRIQLGLCCLNTELRKQGIFTSRKPILASIKKHGLEFLIERCHANLADLEKMIEWNYQHGIKVFRMSSELFPHYNNPRNDFTYTLEQFDPILKRIGALARQYNQRLTFHPGQFNVLATLNEESYQHTLHDLAMHYEILNRMELPADSIMVIHGGGIYADKTATKERWVQRYLDLPKPIQRRLVLENCEKCFSIIDCLEVSDRIYQIDQTLSLPIVFDNLHFECYQKLHPTEFFDPPESYFPRIFETWKKANIKPKFHLSEQAAGARIGKHADFITKIPDYYLEIPEKYNIDIDFMVEAKMKEQAIIRLNSMN